MLEKKKSTKEFAENLKALRKGEHVSHAILAETITKRYKGKTLLAEREGKKRNRDIISKDSLMNYEVADEFHSKYVSNLGMRVETLLLFSDFYGVSTDYLLGLSDISIPEEAAQTTHKYTGLSEKAIVYLHNLHKWNSERTAYFEYINEGSIEDTGKPLDDVHKQKLLDSRPDLLSKLVERIGSKELDDFLLSVNRYINLMSIEESHDLAEYENEMARVEEKGWTLTRPSEKAQMVFNGKLLDSLRQILNGIAADRKAAAKGTDGTADGQKQK